MAEGKFIRYGDKKMPLGNLSLDQAKETLARFFPELANPKVETKQEDGATVYVFTKQAGRKGAPTPLQTVLGRLEQLQPVELIPPVLLAWVAKNGIPDESLADTELDPSLVVAFGSFENVRNEIEALDRTRARLLDIAPVTLRGSEVVLL